MKNKIISILLFFTIAVTSQVSDIANLASGELNLFSPIIESNGDIYGYLTIFKLEDVDEVSSKYEYVLLDKNLNKVANGDFIEAKYQKSETSFVRPKKINNNIIITSQVNFKFSSSTPFFSHRILDLKTNLLSSPFFYQNNKIVEGVRDKKITKKIFKKSDIYQYPMVFDGGFLFLDNYSEMSFKLKAERSLKAFDFNKKLKWEYHYNQDNYFITNKLIAINEESIILEVFDLRGLTTDIHSINTKTGEENFIYYNTKNASVEILEDRLVLLGRAKNDEGVSGFIKIEVDEKGKELSNNFFSWEEVLDLSDIKDNGNLNYGSELFFKDYFIFKGGAISILLQKRNLPATIFVKALYYDYVLFNFDKNFNLIDTETIVKTPERRAYEDHNDYFYSQKINDNRGVVFFYSDYKEGEEKKENSLILGIVNINEGAMNIEKTPMSSKEHIIYPYIAKEGYVLLREYNKDSDYDQIRLERLNY